MCPNWCDNDLEVKGDRKELYRFKAYARTENKLLDEDKFIPYPEKFRKLDEAAREA